MTWEQIALLGDLCLLGIVIWIGIRQLTKKEKNPYPDTGETAETYDCEYPNRRERS